MKRLIAGIVAGLVLALPLSASVQDIGEDKVKRFATIDDEEEYVETYGVDMG